ARFRILKTLRTSSRRLPAGAAFSFLNTAHENTHGFAIKRVAEHAILISGIDVGIVVDLDHESLVADLLEIHAVEAIANEIGRLDGIFYDDLGRFADRQGYRRAIDATVTLALDDLPVPVGHEVFAGIERP